MQVVLSIHAPTRGATCHFQRWTKKAWSFNPRSYKRSDQREAARRGLLSLSIHAPTRGATIGERDRLNYLFLSIHAPTRGATEFRSNNLQAETLSIHAPTRGATIALSWSEKSGDFQSTLLQEERQQKCTIFLMHLCNNYCIVSI